MSEPATFPSCAARINPLADVVLSSAGGFVWASWPGTEVSVKLGKHETVSEIMQEFLDQNALAEHLLRDTRDR